MEQKKVSKSVLKRLPGYLAYLKSLPEDAPAHSSATSLAKALGMGEVQVRKDLALVSDGGRPKIGYNREHLIADIENFLGYGNSNDAVLIGAGKLGRALLGYGGFAEYGLNIVAAFDANDTLIGTTNGGKPIMHLSRLGEGVEVLTGKGPATEKQKEMVAKLLKDFPDVRDSFEYEDYKQAPTLHTASALISAALDSHMQNLQSENGYLKYIATRPGAEKHGAHGLFGRRENTNLTAAMHDLTAHNGNVWTIIYSLHREDAERLGYNNAAAWRKLLVSQQSKFAEAFHIPASALHWYAAYHDADTHPHIHMMIWTDQETVLKRDAVVKLRSAMTNSIFQAELENLYIRKDIAYKDVTEAAREIMREIVDRMESTAEPPASIQQKLLELALELRTVSGKKQYGYLKKPLKDMVDSIVDELEKLPEVAAYYSVWNGLRDTLEGYYKSTPRRQAGCRARKGKGHRHCRFRPRWLYLSRPCGRAC